jgi:hypothetical protein
LKSPRRATKPKSDSLTWVWFLTINATAPVQNAWSSYINGSLRSLITADEGQVKKNEKKRSGEGLPKGRETMKGQDFTITFTIDQTPEEAFRVIKNVRGWWSQQIEGNTDKLGDQFTYRYKDVHSCKMKLIELVPYTKVVWLVVDNDFNFT